MTAMNEPGLGVMGTAVAGGPDRANKAADMAVACPLLEGIDLSGARGVLVLIAASKQIFKLAESPNWWHSAMNTIRRYPADDAHVIYGTAYDETLGDQLRVTVIATGFSSSRKAVITPPLSVVHHAPHQPHQQQQRTGTDNLPVLSQVAQPSPGGNGGQGTQASHGGQGAQVHAPQAHSYEGLNTPSVWRTNRTHAAAKVDALASNGMDEIEIPAFLRKQAD